MFLIYKKVFPHSSGVGSGVMFGLFALVTAVAVDHGRRWSRGAWRLPVAGSTAAHPSSRATTCRATTYRTTAAAAAAV